MSKINLNFPPHSLRHISAVRRPCTPRVRLTRTTATHEKRRYLQRPRYAYITLVMCGDEYAIGAAVLGWSLRKFEVKHELVVMVTCDVSIRTRKLLMKIYDRVETVKYIESNTLSTLRGHEYRKEKEWMKYCLTKGNMMKFIEYDKIIWLDADMLALTNLDEIFKLPTPAGICTSIRDDGRWHGERLPEAEIKESLMNNYGVKGCIMLLKPCVRDYLMIKTQPQAGHGSVYPGPDEYFFTMMYKDRWHHLDRRNGYDATNVSNSVQPSAVHFELSKPWQERNADNYLSVTKWWAFAKDLITDHPQFTSLLPAMKTPTVQSRSWLFLSPVEQVSFKLKNDYTPKENDIRKRSNEKKITGPRYTTI